MMEEIKVKCNICKCQTLILIKPSRELPEDHTYFTCTWCLVKRRREANPTYTAYMMEEKYKEDSERIDEK